MIHRVAQQVQQRRFDLLEDRAINLGLAALDDQVYVLAELAREVTNHPRERIEYRGRGHHARAPHVVLQIGGDLRHAPAIAFQLPPQPGEFAPRRAQAGFVRFEKFKQDGEFRRMGCVRNFPISARLKRRQQFAKRRADLAPGRLPILDLLEQRTRLDYKLIAADARDLQFANLREQRVQLGHRDAHRFFGRRDGLRARF